MKYQQIEALIDGQSVKIAVWVTPAEPGESDVWGREGLISTGTPPIAEEIEWELYDPYSGGRLHDLEDRITERESIEFVEWLREAVKSENPNYETLWLVKYED